MDKKYLSNVCLYTVIGFAAVFLILFVLYHLFGWGESSFSVGNAQRVTVEESIEGAGYLFRDETLIFSSAGTAAYGELSAGEHVKKDGEICKTYNCDRKVIEALEGYDRAIALLKAGNTGEDLSVTSAKLKNLSASLRKDSSAGELKGLSSYLDELQTELNRRKKATGSASGFEGALSRLHAERNSLSAQMGSPVKTVYAPKSGNYFRDCDGYEELFNAQFLENITCKEFLSLIEKEPALPADRGLLVGKIAEGAYWSLAIPVTSDQAIKTVAGRSYPVVFSSTGERITMKLDRMVTDHESGITLLIFGTRTTPAKAIDRCESVSVITDSYTGLTVPAAALRYVKDESGEGTVGVYIKEGNKIRFKKVIVLCARKGCYIAKEMTSDLAGYKEYLTLNDVIVTSGKNLKEGYIQ